MLIRYSVIATWLLLLQTQGGAATTSAYAASCGPRRREVIDKSTAEVTLGHASGVGDTTGLSHAVSAGPRLALEPLPEDYTTTQEEKIISKFWQVLQDRRIKALLACETTLWEIMGQPVTIADKEMSPKPIKTEITPDPRQSQIADSMLPDKDGRRNVEKTEAALEKCYTETRLRTGQADPETEIREDLLREINRIVDQVEACRAAGGESSSADKTQAQLSKIKAQSNTSMAHSELLSILDSSLVRASLDKQQCLESLALPANLYVSLE